MENIEVMETMENNEVIADTETGYEAEPETNETADTDCATANSGRYTMEGFGKSMMMAGAVGAAGCIGAYVANNILIPIVHKACKWGWKKVKALKNKPKKEEAVAEEAPVVKIEETKKK